MVELESGRSERLLPGFTITNFDVSDDAARVVFTALDASGQNRLWLASLERRFSPRRIPLTSNAEPRRPVFGPSGDIFFYTVDARSPRVENGLRSARSPPPERRPGAGSRFWLTPSGDRRRFQSVRGAAT